jgi:hypothetical protein
MHRLWILAGASVVLGACVGDEPVVTKTSPDGGAVSDGSSSQDGAPVDDGSVGDGSSGSDASTDAPGDALTTDASDASSSDAADAATWSPTDLGASLVTWLDASRSVAVDVSSLVSSWGDSSGTGNNAVAAGAARPTRTSAALNGRSVITFHGTSTYLSITDSASLQWGTGNWTVVVVARYSNAPGFTPAGSATFWSKTDSGIPRHGVQFQGNTTSAVLDTAVSRLNTNVLDGTNPFNDSVWRVYSARRVVDTLQIRVNGNVEATSPATASIAAENVDQVGQPVYIGGTNVSGTPYGLMIGDIAEMVAVKGALSDVNLGKLEAYLKTRYAL